MPEPLLDIDRLSVGFDGEGGPREVLRHVSLTVAPGEIVGVVGESGSGKSVTALAVMGLLGEQGRVTAGSIRLAGTGDLTTFRPDAMRAVRGRRIGMIFQEPMTSLNPLMSVGRQVSETREAVIGAAAARREAIDWLGRVGIPDPERRFGEYPHALSGGMRQRIMIAMAMASRPALLIADEPTTALDVTIQAQILALMTDLRRDYGTAMLLITHDMGVVARMADRVVVMYAGEVAETGSLRDLFLAPVHPYTRLLLAAMPTVTRRSGRLPVIPGPMPSPGAMPPGCRFHPRCPDAIAICGEAAPGVTVVAPGRTVRCWRAGDASRPTAGLDRAGTPP